MCVDRPCPASLLKYSIELALLKLVDDLFGGWVGGRDKGGEVGGGGVIRPGFVSKWTRLWREDR